MRSAQACGGNVRNASALSILLTKFDQPFPPPELAALGLAVLRRAESYCTGATPWSSIPRSPDGLLAQRELSWISRTLNFACTFGEWRLEAGHGRALEDLEDYRRGGLAALLEPLIAEHRALWLERSRPGGLDRSARWLERILATLQVP